MSDEMQVASGSAVEHGPVCPWCSATLPDALQERCPSCFATLREAVTSEVPGVTQVDLEAAMQRRPPAQRSRGLIGWLSGEYQPEAPPVLRETLGPPPDDVRREMLRLEQAALQAEVQAQLAGQAAMTADAGNSPAAGAADATADDAAHAAAGEAEGAGGPPED